MRGAGTSIAGNAVGTGHRLDITPAPEPGARRSTPRRRTAVVEPGVVHADLQRGRRRRTGCASAPTRRRTPAARIGGMIGNNACGSRALRLRPDRRQRRRRSTCSPATGERLRLDGGADGAAAARPSCDALVDGAPGARSAPSSAGSAGRSPATRLEHLLPENGCDLARFLVGSEGTLGGGHSARPCGWSPTPPHRRAGRARLPRHGRRRRRRARRCCRTGPIALRGPGRPDRRRGARPPRRRGRARRCRAAAAGCSSRSPATTAGEVAAPRRGAWSPDAGARRRPWWSTDAGRGGRAVADPRGRRRAGRAQPRRPPGARRLGGRRGPAGAARRLPARLRRAAARRTASTGVPYGHFGDGCVHVRIDFPLDRARRRGGASATFVEAAADLVAAHGGSLSGEHGDGRARSELLPRDVLRRRRSRCSRAVKALFDPDNLLNPGVLVDPRAARRRPAAARPRLREPRPRAAPTPTTAATSSTPCTAAPASASAAPTTPAAGGVMCPSYLATRDEKDSTRGRARVLQEMVNGALVTDGWRSDRGARGARPVPVLQGLRVGLPDRRRHGDVQGRGAAPDATGAGSRPRSHYTLGWLPRWARLAAPVAPAGQPR